MLLLLDPALLDQLDTMTALAIVRGARDHATTLLQLGLEPDNSPTAAAAFVEATAAAWPAGHRLFRPRVELVVGSAAMAPDGILQAALEEARRSFPQYQERTAGVCLLAAIELGLDGLARLDAPELIIVGASRFAAWSIGKRLRISDPARLEDAAMALSAVQAWATGHCEPVLHVPYTGRTASPARQALSLAQDASCCARLARERTDLMPREGAGLWQQAAERHAYAAMALDEQALMELDFDMATGLGRDAFRFAAAAGTMPQVMPLFPAGAMIAGAQSVKASLRWLGK